MPDQPEPAVEVEDTLAGWLGRTPVEPGVLGVITLLRAAAGGGVGRGSNEAIARADSPATAAADLADLDRDPVLRRRVAMVARLRHAWPAAAQSQRLRAPWVGVAAAAGIGLVVLLQQTSRPASPEHRAPESVRWSVQEYRDGPGAATVLAWRPVPGAEGYEVEITNATGQVIYLAQTTDTALRIPDGRFPPGTPSYARVRARLDVERWASSDFQPLRVGP